MKTTEIDDYIRKKAEFVNYVNGHCGGILPMIAGDLKNTSNLLEKRVGARVLGGSDKNRNGVPEGRSEVYLCPTCLRHWGPNFGYDVWAFEDVEKKCPQCDPKSDAAREKCHECSFERRDAVCAQCCWHYPDRFQWADASKRHPKGDK